MKKSFSKSTGNPGLLILIKLVIIFSSTYLHGQNQSSWLDEHVDHKIRKTKLLQAEEYQPTPNQDKFDVGYYGLDLSIQPATQTISGAVDVLAYPLADSLAIVELNLSDNFMVKAVLTGNDSLEFAHNNNILRITLDHYYLFNEQIEVAINYNGCPHTTGFGSFSFDLFNGRPMIWSLSEPFGARNWWPCKDLPSDKADSVDIRITVPKGLIVASNGLLKEVITAGETSTYCWHESYPIATDTK